MFQKKNPLQTQQFYSELVARQNDDPQEWTADVVVPYGVTMIDDYAFADNTHIKTITLPVTCTFIGHNAFDGCTRLRKIIIQNNDIEIMSDALINCNAIIKEVCKQC